MEKLTALKVATTYAIMGWKPPSDIGDGPITDYAVRYREKDCPVACAWQDQTASPFAGQMTIARLEAGKTYEIQGIALNEHSAENGGSGEAGTWSDEKMVSMATAPPTPAPPTPSPTPVDPTKTGTGFKIIHQIVVDNEEEGNEVMANMTAAVESGKFVELLEENAIAFVPGNIQNISIKAGIVYAPKNDKCMVDMGPGWAFIECWAAA